MSQAILYGNRQTTVAAATGEGERAAPGGPSEGRRFVITAIAPTLGAPHLHAIASTLAAATSTAAPPGRSFVDTW